MCLLVTGYTGQKGSTIRFKLHDNKGALDTLAKHLGMFTDQDPRGDQPVQITRVTVVLPPGCEPDTVEGEVARVE